MPIEQSQLCEQDLEPAAALHLLTQHLEPAAALYCLTQHNNFNKFFQSTYHDDLKVAYFLYHTLDKLPVLCWTPRGTLASFR